MPDDLWSGPTLDIILYRLNNSWCHQWVPSHSKTESTSSTSQRHASLPPETGSRGVTWRVGPTCPVWGGLVGCRSSAKWQSMEKWAQWPRLLCTRVASYIASFFTQDALGPCRQIQILNIFIYSFCFPLFTSYFFYFVQSSYFQRCYQGFHLFSSKNCLFILSDLYIATLFDLLIFAYCELGLFHKHP